MLMDFHLCYRKQCTICNNSAKARVMALVLCYSCLLTNMYVLHVVNKITVIYFRQVCIWYINKGQLLCCKLGYSISSWTLHQYIKTFNEKTIKDYGHINQTKVFHAHRKTHTHTKGTKRDHHYTCIIII